MILFKQLVITNAAETLARSVLTLIRESWEKKSARHISAHISISYAAFAI